MRASLFAFALAASALLPTGAVAAPCTPTGYAGLTAAVINPATTVSGTVDATGCDIGIYIDAGEGAVDGAHVFGATRFGVMVNGDASFVAMDVTNSRVSNIGDSPLSGNQHGVGIYYRAFYPGGSATGRISGNTLDQYQKAGIVVNGIGSDALVTGNTLTGEGPVSYIAQNGIQFGFGSSGSARKNRVTGHSYTGTSAVSGGIVVVGGPFYGNCPDANPCPYTTGIQIVQNTIMDNDIGVFLTNPDENFNPPIEPTNIKVVNNNISSGALFNNYGGFGYQAGVSVVGNNDKIISNTIRGNGYDPAINPNAYTVKVDADPLYATRVKVRATK